MMYYIFVMIAFELAWLYLLGDRYERHGILYKKLLDVQWCISKQTSLTIKAHKIQIIIVFQMK